MTACDVNETGLKALADEVASDLLTVQVADITSESDVEAVVSQAGAVDVLANVAGIMDGFVPLHDLRDDEWEKVFAVNVTGAMRLSRKVLPIMLAAKKGAIVNVASPRCPAGRWCGHCVRRVEAHAPRAHSQHRSALRPGRGSVQRCLPWRRRDGHRLDRGAPRPRAHRALGAIARRGDADGEARRDRHAHLVARVRRGEQRERRRSDRRRRMERVVTALEGVRVVEAGLLVQGPQAAATLGLLGADVIKVELPNIGDQARWLPVAPALGDFRSAFFIACNRGKRSLALDLRKDRGREAFLRLIETADVLITNFQPGTMDAWGLGYDVLSARNPRLVYAAGSAFGALGPDASRTGADLSAQASGGLIHGTGTDDGDPTPVAVTIADHISGQNLVVGILAALFARNAPDTGSASTCRCSEARSGHRRASTRTSCSAARCRVVRTRATR